MGQGGRASPLRPFEAGHLQDVITLGNNRVPKGQHTFHLVYFN